MDFCINSQSLQATDILDNIYIKFVIIKGELSSAETQVAAGYMYGKLQSTFKNYQNDQLQKVSAKAN